MTGGPDWELLIAGGRVIDGTGRPAFEADVAVAGGRIAALGARLEGRARRLIRAEGLVVAPGFIDLHSHSDYALLMDGRGTSKVLQGVTTEVIGNCGFSAAPAGPARLDMLYGADGCREDWPSVDAYASRLRDAGIGPNAAALVGHSTLRSRVMGLARRPPTPLEWDRMVGLLDDALSDGVFGLSSGLIYAPGSFAAADELAGLASVVGRRGGFYATHLRDEADAVVEAVDEALALGERAAVPVQLSHHKAKGDANWGKVDLTLARVEAARARGLDVTLDVYPYTATSTLLRAVLPAWAHEGGDAALRARLASPVERRRLVEALAGSVHGLRDVKGRSPWDRIVVSLCRRNPIVEGRGIGEMAEAAGAAPAEVVLDVLRDGGLDTGMVVFCLAEEDVEAVLRYPHAMVASDGEALPVDRPHEIGRPHPRSFGTFPRVLGEYVRERRVLGLEEAVRKMTSLPAARLGLGDRGMVAEGAWADLTVFDPGVVADAATYDDPVLAPVGISHVLVNGVPVVEDGRPLDARPGRVLRRGR